jgi:hypothetical protein
MPTVLRVRGYRFIIFFNDHPPAHIHVKHAEGGAKVRLKAVEITEYYQLTQRQLREIRDIVEENRDYLMEKWREIQGDET